MSSAVAILVGLPIVVAIVWLIWYVWNNNRLLDSKLANGDLELLSSTNYKVSEVVQAPAGSRIENIPTQVLPVDTSGYISQVLPDGRIALIPVAVAEQPIKSVHSTTHTNQQPPEL